MPPSKLNPSRSGFNAHNCYPWAGYVSSSNTLEVLESSQILTCRQNRNGSASLLISLLAGIGMGYGIFQSLSELSLESIISKPWGEQALFTYMVLGICLLLGLALWHFIRQFFHNGSFTLDKTGTLTLYSGWPIAHPKHVIRTDQLEEVYLDTVAFRSEDETILNTILVITHSSENPRVLCASTEKKTGIICL